MLEPKRLALEVAPLIARLAQTVGDASHLSDEGLAAQRILLEQLHETLLQRDASSAADAEHPLDRLCRAFQLAPIERDLILLAGLPEQHETLSEAFRTLHPARQPRPSVALASQLLCASNAERTLLRETLERGPAARAGILKLCGEGPFYERTLELGEALWSVLLGVDSWPRGLAVGEAAAPVPGSARWLQLPALSRALRALGEPAPRSLLVTAETEESALAWGGLLVRRAGKEPVRVGFAERQSPGLEQLASVHAVARGLVPVLCLATSEPGAEKALSPLESHPGPRVLCAGPGAALPRGGRPCLRVTVPRPTPAERREAWTAALPEHGQNVGALAARYSLDIVDIAEVAEDARDFQCLEGRAPTLEELSGLIRARQSVAAHASARLVTPRATWEQLVLPTDRLRQLREAVDRLEHQERVLDEWGFLRERPGARGVRLLFAGPPGTGKTLSAEVLAHALGVDLLVVDLSRVVSKWIGETEKNLGEVFDTAERAQAVLLFDEADALFAKRTEVSDAHDRYANLETAYLLTRLERFEGLAVLSTNLRQSLDPAFVRRLEFIVHFEAPSTAERQALWKVHLPPGAPLAPDVSLAELASLFPVAGGTIRNAAVAAGFLAAAENTPMGRAHFVRAMRREYEKAGRAFPGVPAA